MRPILTNIFKISGDCQINFLKAQMRGTTLSFLILYSFAPVDHDVFPVFNRLSCFVREFNVFLIKKMELLKVALIPATKVKCVSMSASLLN